MEKPFFETEDQEICILHKPIPQMNFIEREEEEEWVETWKSLEEEAKQSPQTTTSTTIEDKPVDFQNHLNDFQVTKIHKKNQIVLVYFYTRVFCFNYLLSKVRNRQFVSR